jgi:hypothetical protein
LANSTVSHNHTTISQLKVLLDAIASTVVNTAPTSTMNLTRVLPQRARIEVAQCVRHRLPEQPRIQWAAVDPDRVTAFAPA